MVRSGLGRISGLDVCIGLIALSGAMFLLFAATQAQAQTYTVLHAFTGGADGGGPYAGLTQDRAGNFYGTTTFGGHVSSACPYGCGVVFKLSHIGEGWVLNPIYTFQGGNDGANPFAAVVIATDGTLFGTTGLGGGDGCNDYFYFGGVGCGTVFRLQPQPRACPSVQCPWIETVLYRFTGGSDGATPSYGNLLFDSAGNLYGAATSGGLDRYFPMGAGVVYELTHSSEGWTENVIYNFSAGNDGAYPFSGVIFDSAGNLYGTNFFGAVYELTPSPSGWSEQTLYSLGASEPYGGVVFDSVGNLYGGDQFGGDMGNGEVYELSPGNSDWSYNLLYSFGYGQGPFDSLVLDPDGNIYGTSYSNDPSSPYGEVFELSPANGTWNVNFLHAFDFNDGSGPIGAVVRDGNGNLFGTTSGGDNISGICNGFPPGGCGVVWEITP